MKYYDELSNVESAIIDLGSFKSLFRVLTYGYPQSNREDVESAMYNATDTFDRLQEQLEEKFYELFDIIRSETHETKKDSKGMERTCECSKKECSDTF